MLEIKKYIQMWRDKEIPQKFIFKIKIVNFKDFNVKKFKIF